MYTHVRFRAPETLTQAEQEQLLAVTAKHPYPRDHVLFSMALGTGLRLSELLGLDVGHISPDGQQVRMRVRLDPATTKNGKRGEVFLPDRLVRKLERFLAWKRMMGESVAADAPLFLSSWGRRLSARRAQMAFHEWQRRAGLSPTRNFHCLRHSAVTNVYRASRDLFLAQRFARHASPITTVVYTHVSDEELADRVRGLAC